MEVTGKTLLNSAQNIIKNKKQDRALSHKPDAGVAAQTKGPQTDIHTTLNTQVLRLQASLSVAQKNHSQAQAQLSFLDNGDISNAGQMKFDNEPLFPDFSTDKNITEYREEVSQRVQDMARKLKSLQVEMENMFAFNFETTMDMKLNADTLAQAKGLVALDPQRVAKLTN